MQSKTMDFQEATSIDDLWTPYKELANVVDSVLFRENDNRYSVQTFENVLRRHKQTFLALFKNSPKSAASREEIKRGITEGVNLPSLGRTLLPRELVDEAIIISDMYDVNEYQAVELLYRAARAAPRHPGLPRGILAVLLYYDGRRAIAHALHRLMHAQDGITWCVGGAAQEEGVVAYLREYCAALCGGAGGGVGGGVLDAVRALSLPRHLDLLHANRALPPHPHLARLTHTINTTRKLVAQALFAMSAQRGLSRDLLFRLMAELSADEGGDGMGGCENGETGMAGAANRTGSGALDDVGLALHLALLYGIDLSALQRREDGEEAVQRLPLLSEEGLLGVLVERLADEDGSAGAGGGVRALAQLALGLALATLRRAPPTLLRDRRIDPALLDHDDALVDAAIDNNVFEYLSDVVLGGEGRELLAADGYYQRRLHWLITDFLTLMHSKLTEMRLKAEESARACAMYASEGVSAGMGGGGAGGAAGGAGPPHLPALLRALHRLYRADPHSLRYDYWRALDHHHSHSYRGGCRATTLHKVVRIVGEGGGAGGLRALASLAHPTHTWPLLSAHTHPPLSAHHLLTAINTYYRNLRVDTPMGVEGGAAWGGAGGGTAAAVRGLGGRALMLGGEADAMCAALALLASVARQDAAAAAAMLDNLHWDVLNSMLGLVRCHVPLSVKAGALACAGALGGHAATAARCWAALDAAHLLPVAAAPALHLTHLHHQPQPHGLHIELDEVECRKEEYPVTRAFLSLLESLLGAAPVPRALGAGTRTPGLQPYLHHVLVVALHALHRPYNNPNEKYQVMSACLGVLATWLEQYEVSGADLPRGGAVGGGADAQEVAPPPGLAVLLHLHTDSELLRLVFALLHHAIDLMYQHVYPPEDPVVQCVERSLRLLDRALALERALLQEAAAVSCPLPLLRLSNLMLAGGGGGGGGEADGGQDRLVCVCRAVSVCRYASAAAARALSVLGRALHHPPTARHLLAAALATAHHDTHLRAGFVECLELEEGGAGDATDVAAARRCREGVLALLQQALPSPPPNFAHYLLGYQLTHNVSSSVLSEAGVAGYPRTCLHAILDALDDSLRYRHSGHASEGVLESAWRLVYRLCAAPTTSAPLLRLLRARDYLLTRHLLAHPRLEEGSVARVSARSWALRACACEMGAAAASRHHAALASLLRALTSSPAHERSYVQGWGDSDGEGEGDGQGESGAWLARRLIRGLRVAVPPAAEPRLELFHRDLLRRAIAACDTQTGAGAGAGAGGKRINVSRVHALLVRELATLHATQPQRNLVAAEIDKVLEYVTEENRQRNLAATLSHYFDSWRQLVEVALCVAPPDLLPAPQRKQLILDVVAELLARVDPADTLPQIALLASGTVLLLLVNLRHCYVMQKRESNLKAAEFESTFFGPSMQARSSTMKFILEKILSWLLASGGSQKTRINLYGALLNYLSLVNLRPSSVMEDGDELTYVSRLDSTMVRARVDGVGGDDGGGGELRAMCGRALEAWGEGAWRALCAELAGGADVARMLALSVLHACLELPLHAPRADPLAHLDAGGHLRALLDSLLADDTALKQALEVEPRSLRALYVWECKVAALCRVAGSRRGALLLLQHGALSTLARVTALHAHPALPPASAHRHPHHHDFMPTVQDRYRQIMLPALALCSAVLSSLGPCNHSCLLQVTHFLLANYDALDLLLRSYSTQATEGTLREIEAATSVIARAAHPQMLVALEEEGSGGGGAALRRLHALCLALLPALASLPHRDPHTLHIKVACNVCWLARRVCGGGGEGADRALLPHALLCAGPRAFLPHLPATIRLLERMVSWWAANCKALEAARAHLDRMATYTLQEMRVVVESVGGAAPASDGDTRASLAHALHSQLQQREGGVSAALVCVEQLVCVVWTQLHHHLRLSPAHQHHHHQLAIQGVEGVLPGGGVAEAEGLTEVRKDLAQLLQNRLADDLLRTQQGLPAAQRGFVETLLKDIKAMLQFSL